MKEVLQELKGLDIFPFKVRKHLKFDFACHKNRNKMILCDYHESFHRLLRGHYWQQGNYEHNVDDTSVLHYIGAKMPLLQRLCYMNNIKPHKTRIGTIQLLMQL